DGRDVDHGAGQRAREPIAALRQRLDELRRIRVIVERLAQLGDGGVEARLGVNERRRAPQLRTQLVPSDDDAGPSKKNHEQSKRQILQLHADAAAPEHTGIGIDLELAKFQKMTPGIILRVASSTRSGSCTVSIM